MNLSWQNIFELQLSELYKLQGAEISDEKRHYLSTMRAYFEADLVTLEGLKDTAGSEELKTLCDLRWKIRSHKIDRASLSTLEEQFAKDSVFQGELQFILGTAYKNLGNHHLAMDMFERAAFLLDKIGAHKKSLTSRLNALVMTSRIFPERKLMIQYYHLEMQALEIGDSGVAGICQLNLSREYQMIGALDIALQLAEKAIESLKYEFGTLHQQLALAHRCHLFFQLGRHNEGRLDLQALQASKHNEVQGALKVIKTLFDETQSVPPNLTPTWKARLTNGSTKELSKKFMTPTENKLVVFVSSKARTKFEIINHLYGENESLESIQNRFKVLMSRVNKKYPGLIIKEANKYLISEATLSDRVINQ